MQRLSTYKQLTFKIVEHTCDIVLNLECCLLYNLHKKTGTFQEVLDDVWKAIVFQTTFIANLAPFLVSISTAALKNSNIFC